MTLKQSKHPHTRTAASTSAAADAEGEQQQQTTAAALAARAAELREQLRGRNELVKQLIDRLRNLQDALSMWDSHQRALQLPPPQAHSHHHYHHR